MLRDLADLLVSHDVLPHQVRVFGERGDRYQVPLKNCCDPLSSPLRLISSTKPILCLARIKHPGLVNQRSQQAVDAQDLGSKF